MTSPAVIRTPPFTAYVRYAIALICFVQIVNQMDRVALAALMPMIKVDLHLSDSQLGLLAGLAFSLFYAICGIPIAWWADRGVRRNIIAAAVAVWSVMAALCGAAQNYVQLLLARIGVAAGESGSFAPGASMLCDYVPLARRTLTLSFFAFGNAAGTLVGLALAGWLGETIGWRWTFVALGLPGLAFALLVRFTLREPERGASDGCPISAPNASFAAILSLLLRCRTYRFLVLFLVANGFAISGLYQWWPTFYTRLYGLSGSAAGLYLGMVIGVCGGIGVLTGGAVSTRLARGGAGLPLLLSATGYGIALPMLLASLFVSSANLSLVLIAIATTLYTFSNGPVLAAQYSVVSAEMRATAGSIAIFLTSVVGLGLGPFFVGLASDALAPAFGQDSLRYALLVPVSAFTITVIALLRAAGTVADDLRAIGAMAADGGSHAH